MCLLGKLNGEWDGGGDGGELGEVIQSSPPTPRELSRLSKLF